jgi:hypothetical protein
LPARRRKHIVQGAREMAEADGKTLPAREAEHPIEIFARAYGLNKWSETMSAAEHKITPADILAPPTMPRAAPSCART